MAQATAIRNSDVARMRGVLARLALRGYANLGLTATAVPAVFTHAGQRIAFALRVANTGKLALRNVVLTGRLGAITCPSAALAPGGTMTCHAIATSTAADMAVGHIVGAVTATGQTSAGLAASAVATAIVAANPGISLRLDSRIRDNAAGEKITYMDRVANTGNAPLHGIAVRDNKIRGAFACEATTLAPGASTTCSATYTVTGSDLAAGRVVNVFTASGRTPNGALEVVKNGPVDFVALPEVPVAS